MPCHAQFVWDQRRKNRHPNPVRYRPSSFSNSASPIVPLRDDKKRCPVYDISTRALAQNPTTFVEKDASEIHLQSLRVGRLGQSFLLGNLAFLHKIEQRLIKVQHSVIRSHFNRSRQLIEVIFFDQLFYS